MLFLYLCMKRTETPNREPFKMEIYVYSPACRHVFSWPPRPPTALCIKGNPRSPQQFFLHILLRGYPQWKELLLPVLKHQLGSLRLGAVRGERRHSQLVITALWGFLLQRQQARGNKVSGKKGAWCLKWRIKWRKKVRLRESGGRSVLHSMDSAYTIYRPK